MTSSYDLLSKSRRIFNQYLDSVSLQSSIEHSLSKEEIAFFQRMERFHMLSHTR